MRCRGVVSTSRTLEICCLVPRELPSRCTSTGLEESSGWNLPACVHTVDVDTERSHYQRRGFEILLKCINYRDLSTRACAREQIPSVYYVTILMCEGWGVVNEWFGRGPNVCGRLAASRGQAAEGLEVLASRSASHLRTRRQCLAC